MENGDMQGAEKDFRHTLDLDDANMGAKLALVQVKKVKPDSPEMQALLDERNNIAVMPERKAISLHFALGKAFEDTKQFDEAFAHYQAGCELKRKHIDYNADDTDLTGKNIRDFFTKERIDALRTDVSSDALESQVCQSELPIFVLGMPRSGTTLTETIIASHPQVFGAGELHDIVQVCARSYGDDGLGYPFNLQNITQAQLKAMGKEYIERLQKRAPESKRITDKMPANFNFLGLIHLILPNAKIVHVKRDPVDTCLSCYTRLFNKSQHQSYDLTEIGRYYQNYAKMMRHWQQVLPANAFYEIQYEDLVADQEGQAKALLAYCGLEWDVACMDFHKTERNVRTASVTQVRQPIYKTSVQKWRHYEQHLGPLLDALGDLIH
jgi:tetratricopeptide (TPR) repeat protein